MHAVTLKPRVGYCDIGERLVFLDVDRDRYVMITPDLEMAVRDLTAHHVIDAHRLTALTGTGLFIPSLGDQGSSHPFSGVLATRALCGAGGGRRGKAAFGFNYACALLCLIFFHLVVRRCPLKMRLFMATSLLRPGKVALPLRVQALLAAFHGATLLFPRKDRCLADALALHACLALRGFPTTIVFGVQLGPFQAHCWIQHGDVVLGQDIEIVRAFRPILAVP